MEEDLLTALFWGFASVAIYAAILNIKKKPFSFFLWGICSILYLDMHSTNYSKVVLDVICLITSIYGFIVWSRSEQKRTVLKSNQGVNGNEY